MIQGETIPGGMIPEGMTPGGMILGEMIPGGTILGEMAPNGMTPDEMTREGEMIREATQKGIKAEKNGRVHLRGSRERTVASAGAEVGRVGGEIIASQEAQM